VLVATAKSNNETIHFIITSGNSSDKLMHISIHFGQKLTMWSTWSNVTALYI